MEKANIPKIRFDKFNDDWEQRKLGDLVINHNAGIYISKEDYGTGTNVIGVGNIYDNDIFDGEIYRLGPVNDEKFLLEENDLIYGESSLVPEGIARTVCVGKNGVGSAFAWHTRRVKLDQSVINSHFATLELNYNIDVRKYLISVSTQTALTGMTTEGYFGVTLSLPTVEEQAHISSLFKQLDHLITLHQRKYEKLQMIKKSMLEKMFPQNGEKKPEIRFEGFTDDWEQRKWCDTVDISTEMVDPTSGEYDDMPHIAPGNIESFTGRILDNVKSVKEEQLISGKFRFRPGDAVYGKINPQLGKYFYASVDGLTSADAYVFNGKNGVTQKFLFSLLQTEDFFKYSVSVSKRSGMPKINRDELNAYGFLAPKEEEQEQIGSFLLEIDNLITLHQRKLEKLRNIKKSMLEKMFV